VGSVTVGANAAVTVTGNEMEAFTSSVQIWETVDTSQTPSWSTISSSQTPEWKEVA
jgi:hypothetical protein